MEYIFAADVDSEFILSCAADPRAHPRARAQSSSRLNAGKGSVRLRPVICIHIFYSSFQLFWVV